MKSLRAVLTLTVLVLVALAAGPAACTRPKAPQTGAQRMAVFVSIAPMRYLAAAVGGERVRVEVLVRPGQDPHTFEPTPRQMTLLAQATLFFRVGVDFENGLIPRLRESAPALRVVDTRTGISLRSMEPHEDGEPGGEGREEQAGQVHAGGAPDPHVWMNPLLALRQAENMKDALIELDPAGRGEYERGYARLSTELEGLHEEIAAALAPYRGKDLLVYHPAFGYFADAYGLRQVAVETGGKEPTARQLALFIDRARERDARVIFVQPQFSQSGASVVARAIGGQVVPLDDLAADYPSNLREVARRVATALTPGDGGGGD